MNNYHQKILVELSKYQIINNDNKVRHNRHIGSNKISHDLNTKKKIKIAKQFIKKNPQLSFNEYIGLLNSLYNGKSHTEISIASKILEHTPKLRKYIKPELLNKWLANVEGWAEVDSICQSNFKAEEILSNWSEWKKIISKFSTDENIHKQRACLVLLTYPVRKSDDERLSKLAFTNIDKLKREKNILITKAVSWLLRSLIANNRKEVEIYLEKNKNSLPKIAIRETTRKLITGRK